MNDKKLDVTELIGKTIVAYTVTEYAINLHFLHGDTGSIDIEDDGRGTGNDSHVSFGRINLDKILGQGITAADDGEYDSNGGVLVLKTEDNVGLIEIFHEHNGYYGWAYTVNLNVSSYNEFSIDL
jgi:hypothetical protein